MHWLLSILGFFSFLKDWIKKPILPLLTIILSLVVAILGFVYQQSRAPKDRFLALDNTFVLVQEYEVPSDYQSPWDAYVRIYGTNMAVEETRDYFRALAQEKSYLRKLVDYLPGGDMLTYRKLEEFGSEDYLLLELHHSQQDQASISISAPPIHKKKMPFPTEVYIQYNLWTQRAGWELYKRFVPLALAFGVMWVLLGLLFTRGLKSGWTKETP